MVVMKTPLGAYKLAEQSEQQRVASLRERNLTEVVGINDPCSLFPGKR